MNKRKGYQVFTTDGTFVGRNLRAAAKRIVFGCYSKMMVLLLYSRIRFSMCRRTARDGHFFQIVPFFHQVVDRITMGDAHKDEFGDAGAQPLVVGTLQQKQSGCFSREAPFFSARLCARTLQEKTEIPERRAGIRRAYCGGSDLELRLHRTGAGRATGPMFSFFEKCAASARCPNLRHTHPKNEHQGPTHPS